MNTIETTPRRYVVTLWLVAASLAFILCMYDMAGALINGDFIPSDHDSFYHARRIIDAVPDLSGFYQFDPRIHAPEGSWITWPWGFDFTMAVITKLAMAITGVSQPMSVIAFIAPTFVFVNAALLLAIARQLQLSFALQIIVMLCFAGSMLTRSLHRVGMVDHHFIENMFVLSTLYCGLRWFAEPASRPRAIWLAVVLGLAPAFHNGDFVLQLPVLVALTLLWWRRESIDRKSAVAFAIALPGVTTLALLPSQPFQMGMFSYTLHSWFHFYIAACTAAVVLFVSRTERRALTIGLLLLLAVVLGSPLLTQVQLGREFLFGDLVELDKMGEVSGVLDFIRRGETPFLMQLYSCLIWLLPVGVAWTWWRLRSTSSPANLYLAAFSLFGATLLFIQFRLQYFGSFALWLLPCLFVNDRFQLASPARKRMATAGLALVMFGAMMPSLATLRTPVAPGADVGYMHLREMFLALGKQCEKNPGVVLADHNHGHYITYHTNCSVISDNFVLTRQHEQKLLLTGQLLRGSVADVRRLAPYVKYILVVRADDPSTKGCFPACEGNQGLRHELIEASPPYPAGLRFLGESQAVIGGATEPLARLFEVLPLQKDGQ
jgi:hypothetical protein